MPPMFIIYHNEWEREKICVTIILSFSIFSSMCYTRLCIDLMTSSSTSWSWSNPNPSLKSQKCFPTSYIRLDFVIILLLFLILLLLLLRNPDPAPNCHKILEFFKLIIERFIYLFAYSFIYIFIYLLRASPLRP